MAGRGVQRVDILVLTGEDARTAIAAPVSHAAVRATAGNAGIEAPAERSGGSVEGDDTVCRRRDVEDTVYDDRIGLKTASFSSIERPRDPEISDIGRGDLPQRRI